MAFSSNNNERWLVIIECKNPAQASALVKELRVHALGEHPIAAGSKAYVVYGTDMVLLRSICKVAARKGFATEQEARGAFEYEVKNLEVRTRA